MNASLKICIQPVLNNSIGSDLVSISTTRIKYAVQMPKTHHGEKKIQAVLSGSYKQVQMSRFCLIMA
jgi:hypothetical protein